MTWEETLRWLYALERRGIKLDLVRMRAALEELDRPQGSFRSILVAGTNGKGSTAAALASAIRLTGRTVGLYTSPHLLDFRERIRLNGRMAPIEAMHDRIERDREIWDRFELSFFEATTALAFSYFRQTGVEVAVLEVGLGGRLDATNTAEPILSVITPLGMDHAYLLGSTPAAIALEKAGILRPGIPAVVAGGSPEAARAVAGRAAELRAPLYSRRACVRVDRIRPGAPGLSFRLRTRAGAPDGFHLPAAGLGIETPLSGVYQAGNAALAALGLAILRERGVPLNDGQIARGIARLHWPGRLERPLPHVALLTDVAHNREGARVLARHLAPVAAYREIRIVVGMLQNKDHQGFFREMRRLAPEVSLAPLSAEKAAPFDLLRQAAEEAGLRVRSFASIAQALDEALRGAADPDGPLVLLCGSFHTLEEGYRSLGVGAQEALWDE